MFVIRTVKKNLFSFRHSYLRHFSWRFSKFQHRHLWAHDPWSAQDGSTSSEKCTPAHCYCLRSSHHHQDRIIFHCGDDYKQLLYLSHIWFVQIRFYLTFSAIWTALRGASHFGFSVKLGIRPNQLELPPVVGGKTPETKKLKDWC